MRLGSLRLLPVFAIFGCALTGTPQPFAPDTPNSLDAMNHPDRPVASAPAPDRDGPPPNPQDPTPPVRTVSRRRSLPAVDGPALLRQAAQCLDHGDDLAALDHLRQYVAAFPEHLSMRAHLAELLLKLGRTDQAREQYEHYLAECPAYGEAAAHRVHCHTRLVELAMTRGDDYAEHLHRGGGLLALAEQIQRQDPDSPEVQRILFQAIAELKNAAAARPEEPRPHLWLALCWNHLGQTQPAREHRAKARHLALLGDLSPAELIVLHRE